MANKEPLAILDGLGRVFVEQMEGSPTAPIIVRNKWKEWEPGDPITVNRIVWDWREKSALELVFSRDWFGPNVFAESMEESIAKLVGVRYCQLMNSGSSALLLATLALRKYDLWSAGDFILHPATTFPTSCNPIWMAGMIPAFVDVEAGTYQADLDQVETALRLYGDQIKGMILPHLLGNSCDMDRLLDLLGPERYLIEDCCDTLGSDWNGQWLGSFGILAAFSFYGSHHITTGGVGGCCCTSDERLYKSIHSMTFWGRDFVEGSNPFENFENRYTYSHLGFDMQITELQAAFGCTQLGRLSNILKGRQRVFETLLDYFCHSNGGAWREWLILPQLTSQKANPSWFGFPIEVKAKAPFSRDDFAKWLLDNRVEIRPLFAGNITRQEGYRKLRHIKISTLEQADRNAANSFFLPSWQGLTSKMIDYLRGILDSFMAKHK